MEEQSKKTIIGHEKVDPAQIIESLRLASQMTGEINQGQILQLKMWPSVLFDSWSDSQKVYKTAIDQDNHLILLTLNFDVCGTKFEYKKQCQAYESWCRQLLGDDWGVKIYCKKQGGKGKGKEIYKSEGVFFKKPTPYVLGPINRRLDKTQAVKAVLEDKIEDLK
jgi:hypothetical protein